jgi:hypothetical protein
LTVAYGSEYCWPRKRTAELVVRAAMVVEPLAVDREEVSQLVLGIRRRVKPGTKPEMSTTLSPLVALSVWVLVWPAPKGRSVLNSR